MADSGFDDPERIAVLEGIKDLLNLSHILTIPTTTWAFLFASSIEKLRALKSDLATDQTTIFALATPHELLDTILRPWLSKSGRQTAASSLAASPIDTTPPRKRPSLSTPTQGLYPFDESTPRKRQKLASSPDNSPLRSSPLAAMTNIGDFTPAIDPLSRDAKLPGQAFDRDQGCVITHNFHPAVTEGAHVFPFSMNKHRHSERSNLWKYLKMFWTDDEVDAWCAAVAGPLGSERLTNMITMDVSVHRTWDACLFGLKHLRTAADGKSMDLQFFWLQGAKSTSPIRTTQLTTKPDFPLTSILELGRYPVYYDTLTNRVIQSGDVITLRTLDPVNAPLPDKRLIEMQWNLNRVVAMSGAAELIAEIDGRDDDDDGDDFKYPVGLTSSQPTREPDASSSRISTTDPSEFEDGDEDEDNDDDDDGYFKMGPYA